ncbi:MAG: class I SAM-dependent methyltransferase [Candidatus Limnocylindrales bacterium]
MTTIEERYDASATAYRRWWEPVLAPAALELLERLERDGGEPTGRLLDVGTGAGELAIAAARRWPRLEVHGLDGSAAMLTVAEAAAAETVEEAAEEGLGPRGRPAAGSAARPGIAWLRGHAERLPFDDASFDVVISSFVYQLVPRLSVALREALRVLRPGGRFGLVTWRVGDQRFGPDEAFEDALDDLDLEFDGDAAEEARAGDLASAGATATRLRRLGFRSVSADEAWLEHQYDPAGYLDFLEGYAERETFAGLEPAVRLQLRDLTAARLARLKAEDFRWRVPIVYARARRPR